MKIKLNVVFQIALLFSFLLFVSACKNTTFDSEKYGNCEDGLQNQNEESIDCGGPCTPCASCADGTKNGQETGIDCGGPCNSCSPPCTISPSSAEYTLNPSELNFPYSNSQTIYSTAYYSSSSSQISINFSSGTLTSFVLRFMDKFNPLDTTNIPVNETMVFTTVDYSSFNVSKKNQVSAAFYGNISFSTYSNAINMGQLVYITRLSSTQVIIQMCNLIAGKDIISVSAYAK